MSEGPHPERLDEFLDALADRRRRVLLYYLSSEECADREELLSRLVAFERDRTDTERERLAERLSTELHHKHLPKLRRAGLIEDHDQADVCFRPPQPVAELLETTRRWDPDAE